MNETLFNLLLEEAHEDWLCSFDEFHITVPKGFRKAMGYEDANDGFMGGRNKAHTSRNRKQGKIKRIKSPYKQYNDEALILEDLYADPTMEEISPGTFIRIA